MTTPPGLVASVLRPEDARASYVLARLARPGLRLETWQRALARSIILGVRNPAGCFVALLSCRRGRLSPLAPPALGCRMEGVLAAASEALREARPPA